MLGINGENPKDDFKEFVDMIDSDYDYQERIYKLVAPGIVEEVDEVEMAACDEDLRRLIEAGLVNT